MLKDDLTEIRDLFFKVIHEYDNERKKYNGTSNMHELKHVDNINTDINLLIMSSSYFDSVLRRHGIKVL